MKNTNTSDDILNIIKWLNENISELSDARYAHEKIIPETFDSYVDKVKNNCIYFNVNKFLFLTVKTLDKKLPYTLCVRSFINYKAPNLCSFENVISDYAPADNSYTFNKCTKLNFKELNKKDISISIANNDNIIPQHFSNCTFSRIQITQCFNYQMYDFDNYRNFTAEDFIISMPTPFSNLPQILYSGINAIEIIAHMQLERIINKYLNRVNRTEYIMDMTMDLIDFGREDMI